MYTNKMRKPSLRTVVAGRLWNDAVTNRHNNWPVFYIATRVVGSNIDDCPSNDVFHISSFRNFQLSSPPSCWLFFHITIRMTLTNISNYCQENLHGATSRLKLTHKSNLVKQKNASWRFLFRTD